jgi:hypothetical protein
VSPPSCPRVCFLLQQHRGGFDWKISSTFIGGFAFALFVEVFVHMYRSIHGQSVGLAEHTCDLPSTTTVRLAFLPTDSCPLLGLVREEASRWLPRCVWIGVLMLALCHWTTTS